MDVVCADENFRMGTKGGYLCVSELPWRRMFLARPKSPSCRISFHLDRPAHLLARFESTNDTRLQAVITNWADVLRNLMLMHPPPNGQRRLSSSLPSSRSEHNGGLVEARRAVIGGTGIVNHCQHTLISVASPSTACILAVDANRDTIQSRYT